MMWRALRWTLSRFAKCKWQRPSTPVERTLAGVKQTFYTPSYDRDYLGLLRLYEGMLVGNSLGLQSYVNGAQKRAWCQNALPKLLNFWYR